MGVWIEIHCDTPGEQRPGDEAIFPDGKGIGRPYHPERACYAEDHKGPMHMSRNDAAAVARTLRILNREAHEGGWKKDRIDGTWRCPNCVRWGRAALQQEPKP